MHFFRARSARLESSGAPAVSQEACGKLALVLLTGWDPFVSVVAIAVALTFVVGWGACPALGLLDYSDRAAGRQIRAAADAICSELGITYHGVRFRTAGYRQIIEVHLLFPQLTTVGEAHRLRLKYSISAL
jgi:divalent metal cation (Fe/Co/Zn/Cd) transporter